MEWIPCADITQNHHRRVLLAPALADIGASRLFAHGVEVEFAHELARLVIALAYRSADADPVGFALARRTLGVLGRLGDGREVVHGAPSRLASGLGQPALPPLAESLEIGQRPNA